ncbi:MAG: DUF2071 domain-containing protein, partial [Aggregatilineales bacterium]
PDANRAAAEIVAAGNALGFVLLLLWLVVIAELVLRRSRPYSRYGRMAHWNYPRQGPVGQLINEIANSRLARAYGEWFPPVAFMSNITNVIYVNYLVEAERLAPLVPSGLELQRMGPNGKYALFTHLTYQHGHFGPQLLGPLRRLMPSPVQSNWRVYVRDPHTNFSGIYFVSTAISQILPALLARFLSEGIPMHVVQQGMVAAESGGSFRVCLDPGAGSGPDLAASLQPAPIPALASPWNLCFDTYHDMLAYCVPQDRAMSFQHWYGCVTRQEIALGIPLEVCEPLSGTVISKAAQNLVGNAQAVCFRVPQVTLRFKREERDYKNARSDTPARL